MKKLLIPAVAIAMLAGCVKIRQIANINVNIPYTQEIAIPKYNGVPAGLPIPFGGAQLSTPRVAMATNSQAYLAQYNTIAEKIVSLDLAALSIEIAGNTRQNFDFMDNVQVYVSGKQHGEVLLAYQNNIPRGQKLLNLNTAADVNLKDYFLEDSMYYRVETHINAVPESGETLRVNSTFHLVANPLQ